MHQPVFMSEIAARGSIARAAWRSGDPVGQTRRTRAIAENAGISRKGRLGTSREKSLSHVPNGGRLTMRKTIIALVVSGLSALALVVPGAAQADAEVSCSGEAGKITCTAQGN